MEPILEARDLEKVFHRRGTPDLTAVNGVSFSLYEGEALAIVGESGSGKSTVARMAARLTDPTRGTLLLDGRDVTRAKGAQAREIYRKLQMVFQTPVDSFDPRRTLGDAVGESLRNSGLPRREVRERTAALLEECGLPADFARRYPHQVSGGQCQRAAIARAIAIRPRILICDEATSALDVTVQQQIIELLRSLRRQYGMAYLFICHDLALVQQFCDRVLVMRQGRIVEEGTPDEVILSPKTEYAKMLVDSVL